MHIHIVQSLEPLEGGGLGSAALGFHRALCDAGVSSHLIATKGDGAAPEWPQVVQSRRVGPSKAFYAPELRAVARQLVADTEFVHEHGFYTYLSWLVGAEARYQKKTIVAHVHGFFDPWILARSRAKKRIAQFLFQDANWRSARLWRALTGKEADQIRFQGFRERIVVAPNGLRLSEIDSRVSTDAAEISQRNRPRRVLFLSRIHPKKGLDLLVAAWTKLHGEFPDWELMIVGPDEGGYQREVERLIKAGDVGDSCRILPAVRGAVKNAVFRSSDLFVLPSYSEGLPVAVLEAAAHRLPLVVTDECNVPELISTGGGWQCSANAESFTNAFRSALEAGESERKERGQAGRRLIEEKYTWDKIAQEIAAACEACR